MRVSDYHVSETRRFDDDTTLRGFQNMPEI